MYKIRKIVFHEHPVLKNLSLNFCDSEGKCIDTIIFAGENGTGKSTIINSIYMLVSRTANFEADVEFEKDGNPFQITYEYRVLQDGSTYLFANDGAGMNTFLNSPDLANRYPTAGIYSDVDINFHSKHLSSVTSLINGAFVFVDEPEISLHPTWQGKIMDYYKSIFTDDTGVQTSQIFAVTHSPFVIHNDRRRDDKVIVLTRDATGNIVVQDKPAYFKCTSIEAIQDAFSIQGFAADKPTVYLEGRTDEKYFKKALEVFGYDVPFQFKWVGYMKDAKNEENTGKDALNKAAQFLIGRNLPIKNVCLFDCDTSRTETVRNNVYTRVIPTYTNSKRMKKGIENALILDSVDVTPYYSSKVKEGDYGDDNTIVEFQKMDFCEYICSLDSDPLKAIFANLKKIIDMLATLFQNT